MLLSLERFTALLASTAWSIKLRLALKDIALKGTPEVIINGKYRVTTRMSKGFDGMLKVASFLIEKERQAAL
jgi:thiol:disulfide interchange protein DsbA